MKKLKYSISDMQKLASVRNGKCLSNEYVGVIHKLDWMCHEGHKWSATPNNIKNGKWCPDCGGRKKLCIEDVKSLAATKGGRCISEIYVNAKTKLTWECSEGHRWEAPQSDIKQGNWCPRCAKNKKYTINDARETAAQRGGICLSSKYLNSKTPLKWQCADGHKWSAIYSSIIKGSWCPQCSLWFRQEICRSTFEQLFSAAFPTIKPDWLVNDRGNKMHLDGFNEHLRIAFEYQGSQHFGKGYFIKSDEELNIRKNDDKKKRILCKKNGVGLIVIDHTLDIKDYPKYIERESLRYGLDIKNINFKKSLNYDCIYQHRSQIETLRLIAKDNSGKLLSKIYQGDGIDLEWECSKGHRWRATPSNIKRGTWCSKCAGIKPLTPRDMQSIAIERGGRCLSREYINNNTRLEWQCSEGHIWKATPSNIKAGKWCARCAGRPKLTIDDMQILAKDRGGVCLSSTYINLRTKLRWRCAKGHTFIKTPGDIKHKGQWCNICSGRASLTLKDMNKLAKDRGGFCLSKKYKNTKTNLSWECSKGHHWDATPNNVKRGTWCPRCSRQKN